MIDNQSVSATFAAIDSVTPSVIKLGSVGGCAGGKVSGTVNVTTAPGVTWTVESNTSPPPPNVTFAFAPASGTGSGSVTFTITATPETPVPPQQCSIYESNYIMGYLAFLFSDNPNYIEFNYDYTDNLLD